MMAQAFQKLEFSLLGQVTECMKDLDSKSNNNEGKFIDNAK